MMIRKTFLLAATSTALIATPAFAHSQWLKPSITVLSDQKQSITVDAGASTEPFNANHNAIGVDDVKVWPPDGAMGKIENAARGRYRSTFDVKIDKPGTWRIGTQTSNVSGTFKVNGEDWRVGRMRGGMGAGVGGPGTAGAGGPGANTAAPAAPAGPTANTPGGAPARPAFDPSRMVATVAEIPAGATDLNLTESQSRNEFFVTSGEPTDTVLQPTNKGLELVPVTGPTDLVSNEPAQFRFLVDGKPAAGLKVDVVPGGQRYRETEGSQELTTDANGAITVKWPFAGFYWMNASLTDDKPTAEKATKRRMSYTATLEVVAP